MKKLIFTIALLTQIIFISFGQDLPAENKKIVYYATHCIGKKIGTGLCGEFLFGALRYADPQWDEKTNAKNMYGQVVKEEDVLPGDIAIFVGCHFVEQKGNMTVTSDPVNHGAIVVKTFPDKKGVFQLLNQNDGAATLADSKVKFWTMNLKEKTKGQVIFYRYKK